MCLDSFWAIFSRTHLVALTDVNKVFFGPFLLSVSWANYVGRFILEFLKMQVLQHLLENFFFCADDVIKILRMEVTNSCWNSGQKLKWTVVSVVTASEETLFEYHLWYFALNKNGKCLGTNFKILKLFSSFFSKCCYFTYAKDGSKHCVVIKKLSFFRRKLAKIAEICDRNIGPRLTNY
jgi:hypothetical protein